MGFPVNFGNRHSNLNHTTIDRQDTQHIMSAPVARAAAQATKAAAKGAEGHVLNRGAKRDPELYVCGNSAKPPATLYHANC